MDARIRYTKEVIRRVFFKLLKEKSMNKITVTAICERAKINRATFYRYYDNPFDLLEKIEAELLWEVEHAIEQLPEHTIRKVFEVVLTHLGREMETYLVLLSENGDHAFLDRILELCYQENMRIITQIFPELAPMQRQWLYYFLAEGCNGILRHWIEGGMKEAIEDILDFTEKIVETLNENL